ncbi:MAG: cupin domain-containing protein [Alphaproteobacteria bacterium]|nr:cupin domain-containing protein [Alphaproteobacteria bacterium]MCB9695000.1 cupin domain-containing protein [Alphaproteobacteria bacterium]
MRGPPEELAHLELQPHPEGGFFRETHRSELLTTIDFLLVPGSFSAWHRVEGADEVWNHHRGGRLRLHLLSPAGEHVAIELGGDRFSAVVPAGWWQAAEPVDDAWVLVGCTVSPPFTFGRFSMATSATFDRFPEHAALRRLLVAPREA